MNKENEYIKSAIYIWEVGRLTFCLLYNAGSDGGYVVRILSDRYESKWLEGGPFETEYGAAWSILNYLNDRD